MQLGGWFQRNPRDASALVLATTDAVAGPGLKREQGPHRNVTSRWGGLDSDPRPAGRQRRRAGMTAEYPQGDEPLIPMPALSLPALRQEVATVAPSRLPEFFQEIQDSFTQAGDEDTAPRRSPPRTRRGHPRRGDNARAPTARPPPRRGVLDPAGSPAPRRRPCSTASAGSSSISAPTKASRISGRPQPLPARCDTHA
jgi:hypothetical protein